MKIDKTDIGGTLCALPLLTVFILGMYKVEQSCGIAVFLTRWAIAIGVMGIIATGVYLLIDE